MPLKRSIPPVATADSPAIEVLEHSGIPLSLLTQQCAENECRMVLHSLAWANHWNKWSLRRASSPMAAIASMFSEPHYKGMLLLIIAFFFCLIPQGNAAGVRKISSSISCYICDSHNWTDSNCHDSINSANIKYVEHCKVPKQNHIGVFPARFCVKVIGKRMSTGEDLIIRACSLESMDNQCGQFKFEGELYKGCLLTCAYDGCNSAPSVPGPLRRFTTLAGVLTSMLIWQTTSLFI